MRKLIVFCCFLVITSAIKAQELNCKLVINAEKTGQPNLQVFKTLEKSLNDFINKTAWTDKVYAPNERINCSMMITINSLNVDRFDATLQIQSSRPVYNSSYSSPVFNYNDKDFGFQYIEFQNLIFNPNQFDSNLISVISFYAYFIIGLDADTFRLNGGTPYFQKAKTILDVAQPSGVKGWSPTDGNQTRFHLLDQLLSPTYKEFRSVMYSYHRTALDSMSENQKTGKERISVIVQQFKKMHARRPNSFLQRIFFDAKSDEIMDVFTAGPSVPIDDLIDVLQKVSPSYSTKWNKMKF